MKVFLALFFLFVLNEATLLAPEDRNVLVIRVFEEEPNDMSDGNPLLNPLFPASQSIDGSPASNLDMLPRMLESIFGARPQRPNPLSSFFQSGQSGQDSLSPFSFSSPVIRVSAQTNEDGTQSQIHVSSSSSSFEQLLPPPPIRMSKVFQRLFNLASDDNGQIIRAPPAPPTLPPPVPEGPTPSIPTPFPLPTPVIRHAFGDKPSSVAQIKTSFPPRHRIGSIASSSSSSSSSIPISLWLPIVIAGAGVLAGVVMYVVYRRRQSESSGVSFAKLRQPTATQPLDAVL